MNFFEKKTYPNFEEDYEKYICKFSKEEIKELSCLIRLYCSIRGVVFRDKVDINRNHTIPITLFPSPFPKVLFKKARSLQLHINVLLQKISTDSDFILNSLKDVCKEDTFTKNLVDLYKEAHQYKFSQKFDVGVIRSDYMTHDTRKGFDDLQKLFLVEYNTISVSFGGHGPQIEDIHAVILRHADTIRNKTNFPQFQDGFKKNPSIPKDMGRSLALGWKAYVDEYSPSSSSIIFLIQENERNIYDHMKIEWELIKQIDKIIEKSFSKYTSPRVFILTIEQLVKRLNVNEEDGALIYYPQDTFENPTEVSLIYFRSCYTPNDFRNDDCWETRRTMELSRAIKSPSLGLHLAGTKKIQQLLSVNGILERYLEKDISEAIRSTYTGIFSLDEDNPNLGNIIETLKKNVNDYVLKPQREGGGNNIYGEDIIKTIEKLQISKRPLSEYILMSIILPTVYKNYLILPDHSDPFYDDCSTELGVWGTYVSKESEIIYNKTSGYILRSKSIKQQDGGVASGRAVLDSIYLY